MSSVLPPASEYASLVPDRSSPVWRYASDLRLTAVAGYALLLQVAHPTVGAGVAEHSNFRADPWGRLNRTLDYVNGTIYGGPELAGEIGRRVREMHRTIKGTKPDGERYHAMEPRAYAWVHATLATAVIDGHERFGRPMDAATQAAYWRDWLRVGRLIGVRDGDLPDDWADFRAYFDSMIAEDLIYNETIDIVLDTIARPARPLAQIPHPVWKVMRRPAAWHLHLCTVGTLPPSLREKLQLPWTRRQERAYRAVAASSRALSPVIVGPLREFGPVYVKLRAKQLARGDVARRSAPSSEAVAA